jgi:hypothetical protein
MSCFPFLDVRISRRHNKARWLCASAGFESLECLCAYFSTAPDTAADTLIA